MKRWNFIFFFYFETENLFKTNIINDDNYFDDALFLVSKNTPLQWELGAYSALSPPRPGHHGGIEENHFVWQSTIRWLGSDKNIEWTGWRFMD